MKRYILAVLALAMLAGCEKEAALTPSEVRNWLEITDPGTGGDAVDKKIFDIYEKYGISVFLTDTIGREDRGWRDEHGNVEYYYEMVDLNYDLTALVPGTTNAVGWTRINRHDPAQKARVLPLLELFESKLIPAVGAKNVPHIVMIADGLTFGAGTRATMRGASYLALSTTMFEASRGDLIWNFATTANPELADVESPVYADYFEVARGAFSSMQANIWDGLTWYYYGTYFTQWSQIYRGVLWLDNPDLRTQLNLNAGEITMAQDNESVYREAYAEWRPENYGLIQLINDQDKYLHFYLPPADYDLSFFISTMLTYSDAELNVTYADFPLILQRFALLKVALDEAGIDLDSLRG